MAERKRINCYDSFPIDGVMFSPCRENSPMEFLGAVNLENG